jgi:hypothetical protein
VDTEKETLEFQKKAREFRERGLGTTSAGTRTDLTDEVPRLQEGTLMARLQLVCGTGWDSIRAN